MYVYYSKSGKKTWGLLAIMEEIGLSGLRLKGSHGIRWAAASERAVLALTTDLAAIVLDLEVRTPPHPTPSSPPPPFGTKTVFLEHGEHERHPIHLTKKMRAMYAPGWGIHSSHLLGSCFGCKNEGGGDTSQPHPRVKPTKPPHGFEGGDRSPLTVGRAHCKGGALNPPPDPKAGRRRWWATDPLPFPSALTPECHSIPT